MIGMVFPTNTNSYRRVKIRMTNDHGYTNQLASHTAKSDTSVSIDGLADRLRQSQQECSVVVELIR